MITEDSLVKEFVNERERYMQARIISVNSMHDRRDSYIVESADRLLDNETSMDDGPMAQPKLSE